MIINLTGQPGAGKTTIAKELCRIIPSSINIDGDELRLALGNKDYSEHGRRQNIITAYNIARFLEHQGFVPVISLISPFLDLREGLKSATEVFEYYLYTSEDRGKQKYFVENYEKPEMDFTPIDTTRGFPDMIAYNIWIDCAPYQYGV
jgi:adenylylsulfate kinase-like enzyme